MIDHDARRLAWQTSARAASFISRLGVTFWGQLQWRSSCRVSKVWFFIRWLTTVANHTPSCLHSLLGNIYIYIYIRTYVCSVLYCADSNYGHETCSFNVQIKLHDCLKRQQRHMKSLKFISWRFRWDNDDTIAWDMFISYAAASYYTTCVQRQH